MIKEAINNFRSKYLLSILLLFVSASFAQTNILVIDLAGPRVSFLSPDSAAIIERPADAVYYSLLALKDSAEVNFVYHMEESLIVSRTNSMPTEFSEINDYNFIFLSFGWADERDYVLSIDDQRMLVDFLNSHTLSNPKGIIVDGANFAYDHLDTTSSHYTYGPLAPYFGAVLRYDEHPPFPIPLVGQPTSLAFDIIFQYPHGIGIGPGTSLDDIIMDYESPYASYANYLFDGSVIARSKSPARGMQRRGYTPGPGSPPDAGGSTGSVVLMTFTFGNLCDDVYPSNKVGLMHRLLDFSSTPVVEFDFDWEGAAVFSDTNCYVEYSKHDKVNVSEIKLYYRAESEPWQCIESISDFSSIRDGAFLWETPEHTSSNCQLMLEVFDAVGNSSFAFTGKFHIVGNIPFSNDETLNAIPDNFDIECSPNPFNSTVVINLPEDLNSSDIYIYNMQGNLIKSFNNAFTSVCWTPQNTESGVYSCIVINTETNQKISKKILYIQ